MKVTECEFCELPAEYQYMDSVEDPFTYDRYFTLIPVCTRHLMELEFPERVEE